jgi:hypothetical protein
MKVNHTVVAAFVVTLVMASIVGVLCLQPNSTLVPTVQATALNFTKVGTHPQAAAQPTTVGKQIGPLVAFNGKIYAGYGDYGNNTGPIAINPFDPATNTFTGVILTSPTEAIYGWRIINGTLYAPDTDPRPSYGGYAVGEPWSHPAPVPATHIYDMATLTGSDLWMVGSYNHDAVAWRSLDGGATWSVALAENGGSGYPRFYWVGVLNGKLYVQADGLDAQMHIFDGSTWSTLPSSVGGFSRPPLVFRGCLFDGNVCFNGITTIDVTPFKAYTMAYAIDNGWAYSIDSNGIIQRSSDLKAWESLGPAPTGYWSMAILNGTMYVGTRDSSLYAAAIPGAPAPPPAPSPAPAPPASPNVVTAAPAAPTIEPVDGSAAIKDDVKDKTVAVSGRLKLGLPEQIASVGEAPFVPVRVEYFIDRQLIVTRRQPPFDVMVNTNTVADGPHTLTIKLYDAAGIVHTTSQAITVSNYKAVPAPAAAAAAGVALALGATGLNALGWIGRLRWLPWKKFF